MMLEQKIQRALDAHASQTQSPALTLASAIYQVQPPRVSHKPMLRLLPEFIDAELEHQAGEPRFRALKRHLLICPQCATIYLDLLETAQLDAQHQLAPAPPPRPDLDFLQVNHTGE